MSDIDISQVLAQMRAMAARAESMPAAPSAQAQNANKVDFGDLLKKSIDAVNDTQMQAAKLSDAFDAGDPNVDLTQVMVALQKANVSFEAMTQVRKKLVAAYNEIMHMQT